MSMRSWTATGFGVTIDSVESVPVKTKLAFIQKYIPDIMGELHADMQEDSEFNNWDTTVEADYYDFCEDWLNEYEDDYGYHGFGVLFARVINSNEKDFEVGYFAGEYYEEDSVMYEDRQPWDMSDRVKAMSADDMRDVFMTYLEELGITDRSVVGRCSVEYYG